MSSEEQQQPVQNAQNEAEKSKKLAKQKKQLFKNLRSTFNNAYLKTPSITQATVLGISDPSSILISVTKSLKNPQMKKSLKTETFYTHSPEDGSIKPLGITNTLSADIIASRYSPNRSQKAVLRKTAEHDPSKNKHSYCLEVYENDGRITHQVQISAEGLKNGGIGEFSKLENLHKDVATSPMICYKGLTWSQDGSKLLYMAERAPKKVDIWSKTKTQNSPQEGQESGIQSDGEAWDLLSKHAYNPGFGELLGKFTNLEIFVFDLKSSTLFKVDSGLEDHHKIVHAAFLGPEGDHLTFTALDLGDIVEGVYAVFNKKSSIYILKNYQKTPALTQTGSVEAPKPAEDTPEPNKPVKISDDPITFLQMNSTLNSRFVAYFYSSYFRESHMFATGLKVYDVESEKTYTVVEDKDQKNPESGEIEGLPMFVIPDGINSSFWVDENTLVFASIERSNWILNKIDLADSGDFKRFRGTLKRDFDAESIAVLDYVAEVDGLLLARSNFANVSSLVYIRDVNEVFEASGDYEALYEKTDGFETISEISEKQNNAFLAKKDDIFEKFVGFDDISAFLWGKKSHKDANGDEIPLHKRPAVLVLHGGPHVIYYGYYKPSFTTLLSQGFLFLRIDYSGSWSYGDEFNERLAGKIGSLDIEEVMKIVKKLQNDEILTKTRLYFDGGSYSGFQGFVLLQRYPHTFHTMFIRNPVVNFLQMAYATDIPSWVYNECVRLEKGGKFDVARDYTDEELLRIKKLSIGLADFGENNGEAGLSKTKVYLNIGAADARVDKAGALFMHKKLKQLGYDIVCRVYEGESHPLAGVACGFEYRLQFLYSLLVGGLEE